MSPPTGPTISLDRRDAVARILAERGDGLLVTGLGSTTWDAAAAGDDPRNFYVWGGMGGAAMIGLGVALAQPTRRVLVVTGDGEMLMGLGSLASIAVQRPGNLALVVVDNERYGETGMQPTHTSHGVDLAGMARAAGFPDARTVYEKEELESIAPSLFNDDGPLFLCVKVKADQKATVLPARDGTYLKHRFRSTLLGGDGTDS